MRFADEIIFPSKWLANEVFPSKNVVIYNLIDEIISQKNISKNSQKNEFFTITSFHFLEK